MTTNDLGAVLAHTKNWIFDLDDTLYPPSEVIYAQMARRIRDYIMKTVGVDEQTASVIQKSYYKQYGATVHGLVLEHHISPADFTDYVHRLDLSSLKPDPKLRAVMQALPGRRFVFTNGAYEHAERVLKRIGLDDLINGIFSIREAGYIPKPALETYQKMIKAFNINPAESMMFDDNQQNVLGAKRAGIKGVWISSNVSNNKYCMADCDDFCDYQTPDLVTFLTPYFGNAKQAS